MDRIQVRPNLRAREHLRALIRDVGLTPDDRLPSERDLSEAWGVSRGTVRAAIRAEESEGRLERRPGSGTYIAKPLVTRNLKDLRPMAEVAEDAGYDVLTELLLLDMIRADLHVADQLELQLGDAVWSILRRRYLDGTPAALEYSHVPVVLAPSLNEEALSSRGLYEAIEADYGLQIAQGYERVLLMPCPEEQAELLGLTEGKDVFCLSGVGSTSGGRPVESFVAYARGDYMAFTSELEGR